MESLEDLDFSALEIPPLEYVGALLIDQPFSFVNPSIDVFDFIDDIDLDVHDVAVLEKKKSPEGHYPKRSYGKGKDIETVRKALLSPSTCATCEVQVEEEPKETTYEAKLESTKRKLQSQYKQYQEKRRKVQVLENLPSPLKPQRGRTSNKSNSLRSRKCIAF